LGVCSLFRFIFNSLLCLFFIFLNLFLSSCISGYNCILSSFLGFLSRCLGFNIGFLQSCCILSRSLLLLRFNRRIDFLLLHLRLLLRSSCFDLDGGIFLLLLATLTLLLRLKLFFLLFDFVSFYSGSLFHFGISIGFIY